MAVFTTLFLKIIPLYVLVLFGFVAGRFLQVQKETVSRLLIYIIAPVVFFTAVLTTPISPSVLSLPLVFFLLCSFLCLLTFFLTRRLWHDSTRHLASLASGDGNSGYFAFPVTVALFGQESLGLAALCSLGFLLYENSLGFYLLARGNFSSQQSLRRVLRLPTLYAFLLGVLLNAFDVQASAAYLDFASLFRGTYSVLGMMLIGVGLSTISDFRFDMKFLGVTFVMKFLVWPLAMFGLLSVDTAFFHFFTREMHNVMILMAIIPLAANTVAFATELNVYPEKASLAVFLSTLFALPFIPLVTMMVF